MSITQCEIAGEVYRLDYNKTSIPNGELFQGTLYLSEQLNYKITFLYTSDNPEFEPKNTDPIKIEAIIRAIRDEKGDESDGFF